jgi:hypothetical protein
MCKLQLEVIGIRLKRQLTEGEKTFASCTSDMGLINDQNIQGAQKLNS